MNAAAMAAQGLSQEQLESITSNAEQQLQLEQGTVPTISIFFDIHECQLFGN